MTHQGEGGLESQRAAREEGGGLGLTQVSLLVLAEPYSGRLRCCFSLEASLANIQKKRPTLCPCLGGCGYYGVPVPSCGGHEETIPDLLGPGALGGGGAGQGWDTHLVPVNRLVPVSSKPGAPRAGPTWATGARGQQVGQGSPREPSPTTIRTS